jgi:predicted transglutaminase-like cysteine proteinase
MDNYLNINPIVSFDTGDVHIEALPAMSKKQLALIFIMTVAILSSGCAQFLKASPTLAGPSPPVPATFSVSGVVRDNQGAPVPGAKVSLTRGGGILLIPNNPQYSGDGSSGEPGVYSFRDVPRGEYTIVAEAGDSLGTLRYSGDGPADITLTKIGRVPSADGHITTPSPAQPPDTSPDYYTRNYRWSYNGKTWTTSLSIPRSLYDYYKRQTHDRQGNYAQYATSDYDRASIKKLADMFREAGSREGYSQYDDVLNIVSFVQALPYTSDKVTTGYDEYPRYPVETLVDDGGDCEDTSILTAAMLHEIGYGAVLLEMPDHMAIGVKCSGDYPGTYVEYKGEKYYYLETTGRGWKVGQMPDEYKNQKITVCPLVQVPQMDITFTADLDTSDPFYVYYRVHCNVANIGTGTARNVSVLIGALASAEGENTAWPSDSTVALGDFDGGESGGTEVTVRIPKNVSVQIECVLSGDNFESLMRTTNPFNT